MRTNSAPDLSRETAVPLAGELRDGLGELGLDPRADVNQVLVYWVLGVHSLCTSASRIGARALSAPSGKMAEV
jgi:hypothetical protein